MKLLRDFLMIEVTTTRPLWWVLLELLGLLAILTMVLVSVR